MNYQTDYLPMMKRLMALFPQRPITAETIAAYWELLGDMDGSLFAAAVARCADTCEWFPAVKQLRRAADEIAAAQIADPYERMRRFPHLITNPMVRAVVTTDLSDIRAELEADRDTRLRLRDPYARSRQLPEPARRLPAGE